jgi:hypothetical protein
VRVEAIGGDTLRDCVGALSGSSLSPLSACWEEVVRVVWIVCAVAAAYWIVAMLAAWIFGVDEVSEPDLFAHETRKERRAK